MSAPLRPRPPGTSRAIVPAPELGEWAAASFLTTGSPLFNPEHLHLAGAGILWLWEFTENKRHGRPILGECSIPQPPTTGGAWGRAAYWQQIEDFYGRAEGERPDFQIKIYAPFFAECDDLSACALTEHELRHAGQAEDEYGPVFVQSTGRPKFAIRGHDVELHLSDIERYGAWSEYLERLKLALSRPPTVGRASIAKACGTCRIAA